jgi:hypothetical protein
VVAIIRLFRRLDRRKAGAGGGIIGDESVQIFIFDEEAGVHHSQGREEMSFQKTVQRFSARPRDYRAQYRRRIAVFELLTRLMQ